MKLKLLILGSVILTAASVEPVAALEVDRAVLPRTTVAGRLLATFRYEKSDGFAGAPDVEGHVPADVVKRWLKERPDVKGISVPGMPIGPPGMEGPNPQHYTIVTFDSRGSAGVYEFR